MLMQPTSDLFTTNEGWHPAEIIFPSFDNHGKHKSCVLPVGGSFFVWWFLCAGFFCSLFCWCSSPLPRNGNIWSNTWQNQVAGYRGKGTEAASDRTAWEKLEFCLSLPQEHSAASRMNQLVGLFSFMDTVSTLLHKVNTVWHGRANF